jgi:hypothetical protein
MDASRQSGYPPACTGEFETVPRINSIRKTAESKGVAVPSRAESRALLAYHEAGHFLADLGTGELPGVVSIRREGAFAGLCAGAVKDPATVDRISALFAGHEAAKRYAPGFSDFSRLAADDDEERADVLLASRPPGTRRACRVRAADLVRSHWPAVRALAEALFREETLHGVVAQAVVDVAEGRATPADLARVRASVK